MTARNLLETFGADTHEAANQVLAVVPAIVGLRGTLVDVLAVATVGSQLVAVRTHTSEDKILFVEGKLKK